MKLKTKCKHDRIMERTHPLVKASRPGDMLRVLVVVGAEEDTRYTHPGRYSVTRRSNFKASHSKRRAYLAGKALATRRPVVQCGAAPRVWPSRAVDVVVESIAEGGEIHTLGHIMGLG